MGKGRAPKKYTYIDFAKTKNSAVQRFLHHAQDHMLASRSLRSNPTFLDSAAYMCSLAFELLLKSVHLSEYDGYKGTHNIIELNNKLSKKLVSKKDMPLLKVIDKYNLIRYPIDKNLHESQPKLRLGGHTFYLDEIGTDELERADQLFVKLWGKLHMLKKFKAIINDIHTNPYRKGNRILMQKPRD